MKLGFIGTGNMGLALLKGILGKEVVGKGSVLVYDKFRANEVANEYGVTAVSGNKELAALSDIIMLAVKPNICASVLKECANELNSKAIISVVTGWTRAEIEALAPGCRVLRVMPNTPCLVGAGMTALDTDHSLTTDEYAFAKRLLGAVGMVEEVPSYLMNAVTGVSGSGPAYVYMFIEALADGGVKEGMTRDMAYRFAAQMVLGAAKMVLDTGKHPGALKDAVCSPGGTTIEAVAVLERGGLRAAVLDAVEICTQKARVLSEK